jgi:hypothetical protein
MKTEKSDEMKKMTPEQRESMAKAHEKMAVCLQSKDKTVSECRDEMNKACDKAMGKECKKMKHKGTEKGKEKEMKTEKKTEKNGTEKDE